MAPPSTPRSKAGFQQRLTAKVGPLPVWGWAVAILGTYLLYTQLRPSGSSTTTPTTLTDATSGNDSGAQVPASGQGSPADNVSGGMLDSLGANTSAVDALTSQLLSATPVIMDAAGSPTPGADVTQTSGNASPPPASAPTVTQPTPHPAAVGAPPAQHMTQTAAGKLAWGGLTFTSKAAFDSWAKAHGSSTNAELNNHPQAKAIYSTLK